MRIVSLTDVGKIRKVNQDNYIAVYSKAHDLLLLVCDGIGGSKAGDVASLEIVKYFAEEFPKREGFKDIQEAISYLKDEVRKASDHVYRLSKSEKRLEGMGTTITGLLISSVGNIVINAGDSRVYGFHDHQLWSLTSDHTLVNELMKRKLINEDEAKVHPKRHYLTRFLGVTEGAECDAYAVSHLSDIYLISSDGLHGYVPKEDMEMIIGDSSLSLETRASLLLKSALAKGGYDNITLILVEVGEKDE